MKYCCNTMKNFLAVEKKEWNSEDILYYSPRFDEYGMIVHDSGRSYIKIKYCPWCGRRLPDSKRDEWFEKLEEMGIENPFEDEIPEEYTSDEWWNVQK